MGDNAAAQVAPSIEEGSARIFLPEASAADAVFYNPVQHINRDLTCTVLTALRDEFPGDFSILEAFTASGLRSIRYAHEVPRVTSVIANDYDPLAIQIIERNISLNNVSEIVRHSQSESSVLLSGHPREFQAIDLDPYGTAAPFIDGAVQAVSNGGILCVNSTDARALCGSNTGAGFASYGSMPIHSEFSHEFGIRVLLNALMVAAARHGRTIEPLISLSLNFYFRIFARVWDSRGESKLTASLTSLCLFSPDSASFWLQPMGIVAEQGTAKRIKNAAVVAVAADPYTDGALLIGGPIYNGPLHNRAFCQRVIDTLPGMTHVAMQDRITAMLRICMAELDTPFYYNVAELSAIVKCSCPSRATVISALKRAGFACSLTHCAPGMVKTNAPSAVVWDVIRAVYRSQKSALPEDAKAARIIGAPSRVAVSLEIDPGVTAALSEEKRICKFFSNTGLGPKAAARRKRDA
jgi:tRNA (guanine26-N2/guanine27-N2)-dimethyltransferase